MSVLATSSMWCASGLSLNRNSFDLVHAFYAVMGGFAFYGSYDENNTTIEESLFQMSTYPRHTLDVPRFKTLIYIMEHFPHILTDITEESILDRAASSALSKTILAVQVVWFCLNCIARLQQGLPISLLEVSTAAHAFCTLMTYYVWYSKPLNVAAPTLMREKNAREVHALLQCSDDEYDRALEMAQKWVTVGPSTLPGTHGSGKIVMAAGALQHCLRTPERPPRGLRFDNSGRWLIPGTFWNKSSNDGRTSSAFITLSISTFLYGAFYLLALVGRFPSPLEWLLWLVSSVVLTCSGLGGAILSWIIDCLDVKKRISHSICATLVASMCLITMPIAHLLASAFLTVESSRQLYFLHPSAYQLPSWTEYLPHLS